MMSHKSFDWTEAGTWRNHTQWSTILPELIQKTKEGDIQYITIENARYSCGVSRNLSAPPFCCPCAADSWPLRNAEGAVLAVGNQWSNHQPNVQRWQLSVWYSADYAHRNQPAYAAAAVRRVYGTDGVRYGSDDAVFAVSVHHCLYVHGWTGWCN